MKRIVMIALVLFVAAGHAYAVESGEVPASQQPMVKEVTGAGTIKLEAALYPEFQPIAVDPGTDSGCQTADSIVFKTLKLQPITTVSPTTGKGVKKTIDEIVLNTALLGRQPTDLKVLLTRADIPEGYRKTAKILVTWTVRIEGECPNWHIGHWICEPWVGTLAFNCPAGDVKTYLKVSYKSAGETKGEIISAPVVMQMPAGTTGPVTQLDPTLTGTYVITREDFPDKEIPENLELTILWENFTSMRVHSPDGMRNMIVNVVPVVKGK